MVKPVLMYNSSTWGLTKADWEKTDAFHRKQLKKVLNIKWPTKITNTKLYEITWEEPISITCKRSRWALFGHILRRDENIPANQAMKYYFQNEAPGFPGAKRITLPTTLHEDLVEISTPSPHLIDHSYCTRQKLSSAEDLEELRVIAFDRKAWRELIRKICPPCKLEAGFEDTSFELSGSH